jgi:hypothetical protein
MGAGLGSRDGPSAWPGHAQPVPGSSVDLPMERIGRVSARPCAADGQDAVLLALASIINGK